MPLEGLAEELGQPGVEYYSIRGPRCIQPNQLFAFPSPLGRPDGIKATIPNVNPDWEVQRV